MIYRFRVILDAEEDVIRDIELEKDSNFEDLHNAIIQAFGFGGQQMASFYVSDEDWSQGDEITLFDMSEGEGNVQMMGDVLLQDIAQTEHDRLLYVYDFLNMWTFFVELTDIVEHQPGVAYPILVATHGELPDEAPEKNYDTASPLDFSPEDEYHGDDAFKDGYGDFEDFNHEWN